MRIGLDFDNTIACYDGVFHAAALERGLIPEALPRDKNSVRDYLNAKGCKDDFTELQGYIYGARMDLVAPYAGVQEFLIKARELGHELFIISHKTKFPMLGPRYDLHEAASKFLNANALAGPQGAVLPENIFFELTKDEKVARAKDLAIDVFVDDLPEILAMEGWPSTTRKILFDAETGFPNGVWNGYRFEHAGNWSDVQRLVLRS